MKPTKLSLFFLALLTSPTLAQIYTMPAEGDLHPIVSKSPTIVSTLKQIYEKVNQYFGKSKIRLSLEEDPEIKGFEQVVVEILVPPTMTDAMERQSKFDREWWLQARQNETADILVTVWPE